MKKQNSKESVRARDSEQNNVSLEMRLHSPTVFGAMFRSTEVEPAIDQGLWGITVEAAREKITSQGQVILQVASSNQAVEAKAEPPSAGRMLKTSPQKLNLVAGMIRGKPVDRALAALTFSKRPTAGDVKKTLEAAIANAEDNHGLDVDELVVAEAFVGKNLVMKRGRPRARGCFGERTKITIELKQEDGPDATSTDVAQALNALDEEMF